MKKGVYTFRENSSTPVSTSTILPTNCILQARTQNWVKGPLMKWHKHGSNSLPRPSRPFIILPPHSPLSISELPPLFPPCSQQDHLLAFSPRLRLKLFSLPKIHLPHPFACWAPPYCLDLYLGVTTSGWPPPLTGFSVLPMSTYWPHVDLYPSTFPTVGALL